MIVVGRAEPLTDSETKRHRETQEEICIFYTTRLYAKGTITLKERDERVKEIRSLTALELNNLVDTIEWK